MSCQLCLSASIRHSPYRTHRKGNSKQRDTQTVADRYAGQQGDRHVAILLCSETDWPSLRLFWLLPSKHSFSLRGSKSSAVKISGKPCGCFLELSIMVKTCRNRQHPAGEKLSAQDSGEHRIFRSCSSSQHTNHRAIIFKWHKAAILSEFPAWPADRHTPAGGSAELFHTGREAEAERHDS